MAKENWKGEPDAKLIEAVTTAVDAWFKDKKIEASAVHSSAGVRLLEYLNGKATFVEIGRYGPYEEPTCGTYHLIAERAFRLLEKSRFIDRVPTFDDVNAIEELASRAGVFNARRSLKLAADDDPPF